MQHIFEHAGVMLDVQYEMEGQEPVFQSIHLLDADYRRCGPDLKEFLHTTVLLKSDPTPGAATDACTFLSAICEEL